MITRKLFLQFPKLVINIFRSKVTRDARWTPVNKHGALVSAAALLLALVAGMGCRPQALNHRQELEQRLAIEGKILLHIPYSLPADTGARRIVLPRQALLDYQPYVRCEDNSVEYLHIRPDGTIVQTGRQIGKVEEQVELILARGHRFIAVDGKPLPLDFAAWKLFWVSNQPVPPPVRNEKSQVVDLVDSFMRHDLADGAGRITAGNWKLAQHGGGMPRNDQQAANYNVQRAVNPFTVRASDRACLTYGQADWFNYHAEARFYFGVPRDGNVSDDRTVPIGTDMLVAQGSPDAQQVAFGWVGEQQAFALLARDGADAPWQILSTWNEARPPLTNWMKLAVRVEAGHRAQGILDDKIVLSADLDTLVFGAFHIISGKDTIEVDDVRAWSLPREAPPASPYVVRSRNFAAKNLKNNADPVQFQQWSRSTAAFVQHRDQRSGRGQAASITTAVPLMGDFDYEAKPEDTDAGKLPPGTYEFTLYATDVNASEADRKRALFKLVGAWSGTEWQVYDLSGKGWPAQHREPVLKIRRRQRDGNRLELFVKQHWQPVDATIAGPVHIDITRLSETRDLLPFPAPEHHAIRCANLINEFFEEAPTDWRWIEGSFRMDCRWACQDQWNFMACGATGVPYMTSRRVFGGDQFHEYYLSLRPVFPSDAGDASFDYDPRTDRGNAIFRANNGWYNRHDLNFSFCSDGRNPLSGYSIVFGGDDNRETLLMRSGTVLARTRDRRFLFPEQPSHGVVHWRWWKFSVWKMQNRIRVYHNDTLMFDVEDAEPLTGGHIGFWSVRNGFTVARVSSIAEQIDTEPHLLYVKEDAGGAWKPLVRDAVTLTRRTGLAHTQVSANVGAGFFAVRYALREPVDLTQTPVLHLPIILGQQTALNLHLMIGGESYVLRINAPTDGMKALLTPEFETGECFQLPVLSGEEISTNRLLGTAEPRAQLLEINLSVALRALNRQPERLEVTSLTLGNSSNRDYLLAGSRSNQAGSMYAVGTPEFHPVSP